LLNLTTVYLEENKPDRAIDTGEQAVKANSKFQQVQAVRDMREQLLQTVDTGRP
jgi:hypothetical protein